MSDITLQQLLEAGCHFGHKAERWHPKASSYIYTEKDGIHIIDLVKTKEELEKAMAFVKDVVRGGGDVMFVGTKRQAKDIVKAHAGRVGASFMTERWIGGFLTNWEGIQKTIKKMNMLDEGEKTGAWKKFPKHEQIKLAHHLERLQLFYGGVVHLEKPPGALVIVDIRKEDVAVREALRCNIPIIALVDTNVDPTAIQYPIPSNDDAVGAIEIIVKALADAYLEEKELVKKNIASEALKKSEELEKEKNKEQEGATIDQEEKKEKSVEEEKPKKAVKKAKAKPAEKAEK